METPLVSVSFVAFNQGEYIRKAIESCLNQKFDFDYEIIIHDDASSDNTPQIIQEYAERYPDKITTILQEENQFSKGHEVNTSFNIPKAKGKYIAFLEADDYWTDPLKLKTQVALLESKPEVSMCFTATRHIFSNSSRKPKLKRYRKHDAICSIKDVIQIGGRLIDMGSVVMRRSVFNQIPDWYYHTQIWDLTIPLLSLLHGNIYYLDKVSSVYRHNVSGSWTHRNVRSLERRRQNIKKSIMVTDGFDKTTNYEYHQYIQRKHNSMLIEVLLLSTKLDSDYENLYQRLSPFAKFEYKIFKLLGSFRLWEIYRHNKRIITGY